jgi:xanthine dehydrogenase small subunit
VAWRAVNACILFLPMIDGRALLTVESIGKDGLHPVQQAIVDAHGSQCGFCTPGIVMSLYSRTVCAKGADGPVEETLAGNLCRCTGYGPIIEADRRITPEPSPQPDLVELKRKKALDLSFNDSLFEVKRRWLAPRTLKELAQLVQAHPHATLVAGATDVGLWVTKQHRPLGTLISISDVDALKQIEHTPRGLRIGAGVRYVDALKPLEALAPDFGAMLRRLGSTQVRNSGTIGGNIANGSPIGDCPPPLIALNATLVLRCGEDTREIALEDFFLAYGKQDRRIGEFVEAVLVPTPDPDALVKVYKLAKRFDQDISAVCAAFHLNLRDGQVAKARIAFGGMAATPKRALVCERMLIGQAWTEANVEAAAATLAEDFQPIDDMRASARYRLLAAQNLLRKTFVESQPGHAPTRVLDYANG